MSGSPAWTSWPSVTMWRLPVGSSDGVLLALVVDDGDRDALALVLADAHDTARTGETGRATRRAALEQLDDARQTTGDVLAGHTTGVEGPHRQLRAGLADRLSGDDADGLAELDRTTGRQRTAVAECADAELGVAREHAADAQAADRRIVAQCRHLGVADDGVARDDRAVGELRVLQQRTAEQLRLEVAAPVGGVGADVLHPHAEARAAVVLADDQLLRDVDETAGQVAGVGGTQSGVDEALAGARRGDEVLERLEALTEVLLDRARDHVTTRVGHEAAHAGDLAHLRHVPASTGADHHVDRVEALRP